MVRESPPEPPPPLASENPPPYPATKARGGSMILKTPGARALFIAGLVGAVLVGLILAVAA